MSLRSEIYNYLATDASILSVIDSSSNIHHGYIDGDTLNEDQIVWESNVNSNDYAMDVDRAFDVNTVILKAVSKSAENIDTISEMLKNRMVLLLSTKIKNSIFELDDYFYDETLNIHVLKNEFTIWYKI